VSHQLRNGIKCRSIRLPVSGISPPLCAIGGGRWPNRPSTRLLANMRRRLLGKRCRALSRFRTIQVCPKDRLTFPPAGS